MSADRDAPATTRDAFFGGQLLLEQPAKGHRSGTDAVLLAAAVSRDFDGLVCDVGAGVGAAGLGIALFAPRAEIVLLERDPETLILAERNVAANDLADRVRTAACDLLDPDARRRALPRPAELVVTNPPFYDPARARASPSPARRAAHMLDPDTTIRDWLRACFDLLAPKGTLIVIHAAPALPDILAAVAGAGGAITIKGIHPHAAAPARRVLVRAVKGSRAPSVLAPPLILHAGEEFTPDAERLHRGVTALDW